MQGLNVLVLEDMPTDAELMQLELMKAGLDASFRIVSSEAGFITELVSSPPDVILSDYHVPGFGGLEALALRNQHAPDIPFIFVTGSLGEERAVATLRAGATDYVLKDRMVRLPAEVVRALAEREHQQEHGRVAAALEAEKQLVRAIFDTAKVAMVVIDAAGLVLHANPVALMMSNLSMTDLVGTDFWQAFMTPDDGVKYRQQILQVIGDENLAQEVWRAHTRGGRIVLWSVSSLQSNSRSCLVLAGIDVTEREQAEERLYFLDNFDQVTNLPNRKLLLQQLRQHCQNMHSPHRMLLVALMIGVGRIKEIHDSYGEQTVNAILLDVVQRLRVWQVKSELLARVSDNTFALVFEVEDDSDLVSVIPRILQELNEPMATEDKSWVLPAHGGVAIYHRDAQSPEALLQAAESALHRSENQPGDKGYAFYSSELSDETRHSLLLESELRDALKADDQLVLYYQPQLDLADQRVIGFEALIRWQHPRLGFLLPDSFIHIAEDSGLMPELGKWVLSSACRQLARWRRQGMALLPVAINISASQFASPFLLNDIEEALDDFGVPAELLELELTESASMLDPLATIMIMTQLRHQGVGLAIDDFGTGYSNLSYLKRFPVHRLKLDQTFVRDIMSDSDDLAISHAVIAIAHQLNLQVVAEGIETLEQLHILQEAKCDFGQGYLFSVPVPGERCQELIGKK